MRQVRLTWPLAARFGRSSHSTGYRPVHGTLAALALGLILVWFNSEYDLVRGNPAPSELPNPAAELALQKQELALLSPALVELTPKERIALKISLSKSRSKSEQKLTHRNLELSQPEFTLELETRNNRGTLNLGQQEFTVRGQLFMNLPPGSGPIYVHVSTPSTDSQALPISVGGGPVQPNGDFEINAWSEIQPDTLQLAFSDERGTFHVREVAAGQLWIPLGESPEAEVEEFFMQVFDDAHNPVKGAQLRILAKHVGPSATWNIGLTDDEGRVGFLLPSGPIEYYLTKAGLRFEHGRAEWDTKGDRIPLTLTLETLNSRDVITGQTLDNAGASVSNALVTAGPLSTRGGLSNFTSVSTRSDSNGRFSLKLAGNTSIALSASHGDLGQVAPLILNGGEQGVSLIFPPEEDTKSNGSILRSVGSE